MAQTPPSLSSGSGLQLEHLNLAPFARIGYIRECVAGCVLPLLLAFFPGQKVFKLDQSAGALPQPWHVTEGLTATNWRRVLEKRANQEGAEVCPGGL